MSIFPVIIAYADKAIEEFQELAQRINRIALEQQVADARDITRLGAANARAMAALNVKDLLVISSEDDLGRVIQRVKNLLNSEVEDDLAQMDAVRFYIQVKDSLTRHHEQNQQ